MSDHGHGGGGHAPAAPKASGGGGGGGGAIGAAAVTLSNGVLLVSGIVLIILGHRFILAHPDATNILLALAELMVLLLIPYWGFRKLWGDPASRWSLSTLALGAWTAFYSWLLIQWYLWSPKVHNDVVNHSFQTHVNKSMTIAVIFWIALYLVYGALVDTAPKPVVKKP